MKLKKTDPFAGHRESINEGRASTVFLKPLGAELKSPVEVGEVFVLRRCGVEVTRKQKIRKDGEWVWKVDFLRIRKASKPRLLKRGGGYTHDPDLAMSSQDDLQNAATLSVVTPDERSEAHRAAGEPPEPEVLDDVEVWNAEASQRARERFALLQHQLRAEEREEPLLERLTRIAIEAKEQHIDLSGDERVIERRARAMEAKLNAKRTPSGVV
jgi:hypothetical protein